MLNVRGGVVRQAAWSVRAGTIGAVIVGVMGSTLPAQANNYYFSTAGSASGDGSLANPFNSISTLNSLTLGAGDNVYLRGGDTFSGSVYFGADDQGTSSNPITVSTYGTGQATISSGSSDGIYLENNGGFSLSNLNLVGNGYTNNFKAGIDAYNFSASQQNYLHLDNISASGYGNSGILIGGSTTGYNDVRITNSSVHDNGRNGIATYGGTFNTTTKNYANSNVYIGHTKAYNNTGLLTDTGQPSGNGIVLGSVNGGTIERSVASNNGANSVYTSGAVGIMAFDANNITVQHNESYSNHSQKTDGDGFDFDINTTNSVMQFNYAHDNDGAGLLVYGTNGLTNSGNVVRYNISQNDVRKFAMAGILVAGSAVNGVQVYNNTAYFDKTGGNAGAAAAGVMNLGGSPTGVSFRNNIFVSNNGGVTFQAAGETSVQGNDYWAIGQTSAMIIDRSGNPVDLATFRADSSNNKEKYQGVSYGYNVNPGLTNAGGAPTLGDADLLGTLTAYKLISTSALINAGINLKTLFGFDVGTQDFYGILIPQGSGYEIGASEYAVPEPASLSALGLASLTLLARRRKA